MRRLATAVASSFARFGLVVVLATAGLCARAEASPLPQGWTSVRALGMGNAYTAIVRDNDAIFYNPAGIAAVEGFSWTIADPRVGANAGDAYELYQSYSSASGSDPADLFQKMYGRTVWVGGGGKAAISVPGFGFAAFTNADAHLALTNPAYPVLETNYFVDYGFAGAAGVSLIPGVLRTGIALKRVNRTGASMDVGASTLAQLDTDLLQSQLKNRGTAYGMDLGMQLTVPTPIVKPTFAISWRDVGYTTFNHEEGPTAPPPIAPNLTVGAALEVGAFGFSVTPAVDFRYLDRQDVQMGKKIGFGVEFHVLLLNLRAGVDQGYATFGAGMDLGLIRVDAATWGAELGEYPGQQLERRYMLQLTMEIDFDPLKFLGMGGSGSGGKDGASGGGSGSRPRLKQRR